jgi:hypothetical protein
VIESVRAELEFDYAEVDITGDPELEERHRGFLPVVEIDGERVFVYHVVAEYLRREILSRSASQGQGVRLS